GCGGFLLTGWADDLESYYTPGDEVGCFTGVDELVAQIRYYLSHADEREAAARAGHERTLREHTYVARLARMFERMSLPASNLSVVNQVRGGNIMELASR